MAYVLGFFAADGNMIRNRRGAHFVAFYNNDLEILAKIRIVIGSNHKIGTRTIRTATHKQGYQLQIGSKQFFSDLISLGLTPRKSLDLRLPEIPHVLFGSFVRGYFDGDGCVYFKQHFAKDRQKLRWSFSSRFTSGAKDFLMHLQKKLHKYGLHGGYIYKKSRGSGFELAFSNRDSIALYHLMYDTIPYGDLFLSGKQKLFQEAVSTIEGT